MSKRNRSGISDGSSNGDEYEPPQKRKQPKILDGKYFKVVQDADNTNKTIVAICTTCDSEKKGSNCSTGNFLTHYRLKHKEVYNELADYLNSQRVYKRHGEQQNGNIAMVR